MKLVKYFLKDDLNIMTKLNEYNNTCNALSLSKKITCDFSSFSLLMSVKEIKNVILFCYTVPYFYNTNMNKDVHVFTYKINSEVNKII